MKRLFAFYVRNEKSAKDEDSEWVDRSKKEDTDAGDSYLCPEWSMLSHFT